MVSCTMNDTERCLEMSKEFASNILEWADSVQVFVTVHDQETRTTRHLTHGVGNWFSREGQVREWVLQNEERSRSEVHTEED